MRLWSFRELLVPSYLEPAVRSFGAMTVPAALLYALMAMSWLRALVLLAQSAAFVAGLQRFILWSFNAVRLGASPVVVELLAVHLFAWCGSWLLSTLSLALLLSCLPPRDALAMCV